MERDIEILLQEAARNSHRVPDLSDIRRRGGRRRRVARAGVGLLTLVLLAGGVGAATRLGLPSREAIDPGGPATPSVSHGIVTASVGTNSGADGAFVINPDTGETTRVLGGVTLSAVQAVSWSPTGEQLAFAMNVTPGDPETLETNHEIFIANVDGTGLRRLTNRPGLDTDPTWAPNGERLAFTRWYDRVSERDGASKVFTINLATGEDHELTSQPGSSASPDWSPDGERVAYTNTVDGTEFHIWQVHPDGDGAEQVTTTSAVDLAPQWSPDGDSISFIRTRQGQNSERAVYAVDQAGNERKLFDSAGYWPVWSPDGSAIAYVDSNGGIPGPGDGPERVVVVDLKTGERTQVGPNFNIIAGAVDWR